MLRPTLEAAFAVARAGLEATPPVPPPPPLRPFLSFRRLSGRALERARRVLDEDEEFRTRVRDAVDRDDVGEAGWLLLDRPDGWDDRLGEVLGEAVREADEVGSAEEAARLGRELTRAIEERDEAMAAARQARTEQDRAARTLTDERAGREAAEERVAALEQELGSLREQRAAAVRDLKALEVRSNARLDELKRAQADLATARSEVAEMEDGLAGIGDPGTDGRSEGATPTPTPAPRHEATRPRPAPGPRCRGPRRRRSTATRSPPWWPGRPRPPRCCRRRWPRPPRWYARSTTAWRTIRTSPTRLPSPRRPRPPARRRPRRASGPLGASRWPSRSGCSTTRPEAALHLLRHPGTTLAVDGYNVSLAGWPTLALSAQRRRLIDALEALAARTGCGVTVVFDGADVGRGLPGESRPRGVQVRFTAPGVEADDELLALLDALPVDRPITVASSDRRVADGSRRRGASVISTDQLLAILDA